jgi:hypothetical protein
MDIIPEYRMGDAQEITNAGLKIFGDIGTTHVLATYLPLSFANDI